MLEFTNWSIQSIVVSYYFFKPIVFFRLILVGLSLFYHFPSLRYRHSISALLSILNNAVVYIDLILPPISNILKFLFHTFRDHSKRANCNQYHYYPHVLRNLHLPFCYVLSIFALIQLVLMAWFCAAIKKTFLFLLRFPFHSHAQDFACKISSVCRLKY